MFDRLGSLVNDLKEWAAALEAGTLDGAQAATLVGIASEGERVLAGVRMLAADRVAETGEWQRGGHRSPADWLARQTKTDAFRAKAALEAAARFGDFPLVAAAVRAGGLSESQAHLIVDTAGAREGAEAYLVDFAHQHSLRRLAKECRRLKSAALDQGDDAGRLHKQREWKCWESRDGMIRGTFAVTPEAGALPLAFIQARVAELNQAARAEGRQEPFAALAADAFVQLITEDRCFGCSHNDSAGNSNGAITSGAGIVVVDDAHDLTVDDRLQADTAAPGGDRPADTARSGRQKRRRRTITQPRASVVVIVDYDALIRGSVEGEEVCEIKGIGPVPVSVARRLLDDCVLYLMIKRGGAPAETTPGVRTIPKSTRLKVEAQDQWRCAVPGCDQTKGLEIHHIRWHAKRGNRKVENLVLVCRRHHDLITYNGWLLTGPPEAREFLPPGDWAPEAHPPPETPYWSSPWAPTPEQAALAGI